MKEEDYNIDTTATGETVDLSDGCMDAVDISTITFDTNSITTSVYPYANGSTYTIQDGISVNTTFPGDIEFQDSNGNEISLADSLNKINERLAIVEPNFEKMERFPALRKAYEHYKTVEAMLQDDSGDQ